MKFLITIEHHDLTDVPPNITLDSQFYINAGQADMDVLERKINDVFRDAGDGNDEYHTIKVTNLDSIESWTTKKLDKWLNEYKKANIGDDGADD